MIVRRYPRKMLTALTAGALFVMAAQASAATKWKVQPTPNPGGGTGYPYDALYGVSATSTSNAWAVGVFKKDGYFRTLIERYDGTAWQHQVSINVGPYDNILRGVRAISKTNAWAVGWYRDSGDIDRTLIEHYDGSAWTRQASPNPHGGRDALNDVAAASPSNAWAVGAQYIDDPSYRWRSLVEHYNGTSWAVQSSISFQAYDNELIAVSALSPTNAWAVGYFGTQSSGPFFTLVEHYDGSSWNFVNSPDPGGSQVLYDVSAVSASDIWAVGSFRKNFVDHTLIEHYDGFNWTHVPSPNPQGQPAALFAVKAISASDVWAVGEWGQGIGKNLIEHYDGTKWTVQASPNVGQYTNALIGVGGTSSSNLFAVGESAVDNMNLHWYTLAMHCC